MTKKALKAVKDAATEAYQTALYDIDAGYKRKQEIYNMYFNAIYIVEGIVDALCTSDEKVEWGEQVDEQHKTIRKILKI